MHDRTGYQRTGQNRRGERPALGSGKGPSRTRIHNLQKTLQWQGAGTESDVDAMIGAETARHGWKDWPVDMQGGTCPPQ